MSPEVIETNLDDYKTYNSNLLLYIPMNLKN